MKGRQETGWSDINEFLMEPKENAVSPNTQLFMATKQNKLFPSVC